MNTNVKRRVFWSNWVQTFQYYGNSSEMFAPNTIP